MMYIYKRIRGWWMLRFINAIDWNRVLLQSRGEHARIHPRSSDSICPACIKTVLLRTDE